MGMQDHNPERAPAPGDKTEGGSRMGNIIARISEIISRFQTGGAASMSAIDFLWIAAAIAAAILAIRVVGKIIKILLIIAAVVLLAGFLFNSGLLPL
jgi:hypothetical protein